MAKLPTISFVVVAAASVAAAQSGRKIEPDASPRPLAVEKEINYSESTPRPQRLPGLPASFSSSPGNIQQVGRSNSTVTAAQPPSVVEHSDEVLKIDTSLVTIPVSVFDRNGLYVPNLKQSDFMIYEDGKEQKIEYFGTTDKPFTVILLIDTSPSTDYKIEEIRQAATNFVNQLKPEDRVMVIEFDENIHVLTEVTGDRKRIHKAIRRADFGYGTSLYDAVDFSLRKHLNKIDGRKAVVLFTDGVDTTSDDAGYETTLAMAEEADALFFPIYYNTLNENKSSFILNQVGTRPQDYALGKRYLDELAGYTGGRVFQPEATPGGLTAAFVGIAEELRRQYNIGYVPSETGTPGQRKQIKVRVNQPNLVLRARDSYFVGASRKPKSFPAPANNIK
jgi:VWFA-related protein